MTRYDPIQVAMSKAVTETASTIDAYLLSFFGSEENVKKFGSYYILETKPASFKTVPDDDQLSVHIVMRTEYRLRVKTKEELEATP